MALAMAALAMAAAPSGIEPRFAPQTGAWVGLRWDGAELACAPAQDVVLHAEGAPVPPYAEWRLVALRRKGPVTTVERRAGDWEIDAETTCVGGEVRRRVRLRWLGQGSVTVRGVALRTPAVRLSRSPSDWALVPGNFPIARMPLSRLRDGQRLSEAGWTRGDYGLGIVHSAAARCSIVGGYRFERDQARVSIIASKGGAVIEHAFDAIARLEHGDGLEVAEQVLRLSVGDEAALRAAVSRMSDALGNGPPADQPAGLARTVLYEVHPWGRLEAWGQGDRGMRYDRLTRLLPYYRHLGVTALWLLPVSWPPPWVYTRPAFDRIAPENGTPRQLKDLVASAHRHGIRALIDLVVYGIHPDADEAKRLPADVWCADPEGKPTRVWGGTVLAADTSHPMWQKRIAEVVNHWARDFGFDGTRLDCIGWGQAHNYASKRPSDAVAYGGLQLNKVVRDAFRKVNREAVTLPEGGKPLVFRNADMVFDYPLYLAMRDLTWQPNLARWVADLREWLEWERLCYPSRARKGLVRFLECHDIVAATEYFGVGPSQALLAACILMQGVPLLQQEQEIGFSDDVAKWLHLRNRERCFYEGDANYLATLASDGRLLTFLRSARDGAAVVALNLTGEPIRASVQWPSPVARAFPAAWDAFSGAKIAAPGGMAIVTVPPYRPVVLLLKPHNASAPSPIKIDMPGPRWTVRTSEGVLTDAEQDYTTKLRPGETLVDALPVLKRARQAEAHGLMDGVVPKDVRGGPVDVRVDPIFVTLTNATTRLTLARRHGGVIAALGRTGAGSLAPMIVAGGDCYTDNGFFPSRLYASVDGETNPRLHFARQGDAVTVAFSGTLRQRAWNGVQTCAVPGPPVAYELTYTMDATDGVVCRMALTPSADVAPEIAFYALRVPLAAFGGWARAGASGSAGAALGTRLGQAGDRDEPLTILTGGAKLVIEPGEGLRSAFVIESDGGAAHLFLALLDGGAAPMRAGQTIRAEARLRVIGH